MSAQANYFKIGLFVIGATIALVFLLVMLGAGRIFQSKILMETYFNESVQGLEVGSKVKYRGVIVGEVKSIGFTYTKYQQDITMSDRLRYVMVQATILPRLIGRGFSREGV
jgi:paraquat-inducible protein B